MDPKLLVAEGDGCLSLAQELFAGCDLKCQSMRFKNKLGSFLLSAIKNYEEALSNEALEGELREKVEANLQEAHGMFNVLVEIIRDTEDLLHALEAFEEYLP